MLEESLRNEAKLVESSRLIKTKH